MEAVIHIVGITVPLLLSPGANNLLLMNAGARTGLMSCLPHIFGSVMGFVLMLCLCHWGLSTLIAGQPEVMLLIRWTGAAWLLWLAWLFFQAKLPESAEQQAESTKNNINRPFGFFSAMVFMWVNPGALTLSLLVFSVSADVSMFISVAVAALVGLAATLLWTLNGQLLSPVFADPRWHGRLMKVMGSALVFSAINVLG